ncbi:MAG: O-antigen ligase family protein [Oryzihumus sp.]
MSWSTIGPTRPRVLLPLGARRPGALPGDTPGAGVARRPAGTMERVAVGAMAVTFAVQFALRPSGPGNSSPVDVLTLLSLLAVALWATSAAVRVRVPYGLGAGLMILGGALAGLVSLFPGQALLALVQDLVLISWATAVGVVARRPGGTRLLASVWAYSAMVCAAVLTAGYFAHVQAVTGVVSREGNRAMFTFGDPNYAASFWVLSIFVAYASGVPRRRPLRVLGYLLLLWAVVLSLSNGAWVELAAGCLLIVAVAAYRRVGMVGAVGVVLLVAAAAGVLLTLVPLGSVQAAARASGQPLLVNSVGRSNESSSQRDVLVREALQLYRNGSPLGTGPGSTKLLLTTQGYPYAKEAHDDFLAALVERGPLGILGLLVLVSSAVYRSARVLRAPPRQRLPDQLPRPVGLVAGLAAALAASTYYEVLHFRYVWGLLALVAACAYEADRAAAARAAREVS